MTVKPIGEEKEICITKDDGKTILLCLPELEEILCQPDCIDKKVSVVSMSGNYRTGKSFLLNYMLRYLRAGGRDGWIGGPDEPLKGFTWGGGVERVTEGVWAWNRIYPLQIGGEEERVVFLVDTEGSFDNKKSTQHCAQIFAWSIMLSSIQVHSISERVKTPDLSNLNLFTDFSQQAKTDDENSVETILLLIRNWKNDEDHPLGWEDDKGYIETVIQDLIDSKQGSIPKALRAMFTTLRSFLLPTIGRAGDGKKVFDGCHSKLDPKFREYMEKFICGLFNPTTLKIKTIDDCPLTCGQFFKYCIEYNKLFMKWDMPKLRSIDQANAQLRLEKVRDQCEIAYMEELAKMMSKVSTLERFEEVHEKLYKKAMKNMQAVGSDAQVLKEETHILKSKLGAQYKSSREIVRERVEITAVTHNRELLDDLYKEYEEKIIPIVKDHETLKQLINAHCKLIVVIVRRLKEDVQVADSMPLEMMDKQLRERVELFIKPYQMKLQLETRNESNTEDFAACGKKYEQTMNNLKGARPFFETIDSFEKAHKEAKDITWNLFNEHFQDESTLWRSMMTSHIETRYHHMKTTMLKIPKVKQIEETNPVIFEDTSRTAPSTPETPTFRAINRLFGFLYR